MKQRLYLLTIFVMIFFLAATYANMHLKEPKENPQPALTEHAPVPGSRTTSTIDSNRGKLLYDNHCTSCHNERIHSVNSNNVKSASDIKQWVIRWSRYLQLDWEENDIDLVVEYLNLHFYHFTSPE